MRRAREASLSAIAITDHDSVSAFPAAAAAARRAGAPELLSGVELTVRYRDRELHLLGYGFDAADPTFGAFLSDKRLGREDRMRAMIERLNAAGVRVTFEEVRQAASATKRGGPAAKGGGGEGESLGRPHLAQVLVDKGYVPSQEQAFKRYIGDSAPCFVHKATLTLLEAVRWLRQRGGVTVLAHPLRMVPDAWISEMVHSGLQGIEAYHPDHPPSAVAHYLKLARELNLLVTGGSDCHGFRRERGPSIGTVEVPGECLDRLREAIGA